MKKGKPKATPRRTSWRAEGKSSPAPVYGPNTVIVCRHGVPIKERCAQCRQARRRGCLLLLAGLFLFFTLTIATMHPANKRAMCKTMGIGDFTPLICR
ncbi:MAG: hypothetical protein OXG78_06910 [Chloroflexi bacterium]|nr:hypothetical protein [Chloroflexota bacterium]